MARVTQDPQTAKRLPATPLESMMRDHLHALAVQNYSEHTVRNRAGPSRLLHPVVPASAG